MDQLGLVPKTSNLKELGLEIINKAYWNLSPAELTQETLNLNQGVLSDKGALVVNTGEFTGRSPKDRFIVCDENTEETVWWGDINIKFTPENFIKILKNPSYLLTYYQIRKLYAAPRYTPVETKLLKPAIQAIDPLSCVFMYKELFEKEIYKFKSNNPAPVIIDCGANIGLAIIYWKRLFPEAHIKHPVKFILNTPVTTYRFSK